MTCSLRAHAPGSGGLNRGRAYAALVCGRLLGEWHDAAPAGRYSARAMVIAARGTRTHQRWSPTPPPAVLFRRRSGGGWLAARPAAGLIGRSFWDGGVIRS